jgi:tripartite ATP-independent transporter DctM subunit
MEVWFLILLLVLMVGALSSGFPVAFTLPGAAILSIALAALCGWLFVGDADAFFIHGGPNEWLSAGVTNFRSLYWVVERDTLIAIPLFVFMGIMLQRSRIAEDLLVAMARLFGPVPGGLGISVVFVGALLAATTGIVGATVIAMGLISLPAMLRNNYSHSLACGTICASGTLGQIIPPSIVLIILADQLSSAADQANTARKAEYREVTGEFSMPSDFDVVSASAGDMFMGALLPGLILVGLYMLYIFVSALINPRKAPPVPYDGAYDRKFFIDVLLALAPPLLLIFIVLGSILLGVATVNQAGAVGAVGALLMGSYRLYQGRKRAYLPAALALLALIALAVVGQQFDLNIRNVESDRDRLGILLAVIAVVVLLVAVLWAIKRAWRCDNILHEVMLETARTTSMVFIILIGAAMLTSAFRGFGGEELVKHYLTGLPGGFWTQFIVVMLVIFLLGFFLDFIEIAVVVVPIVAPILLANPEANVTAVWLGVMVGLNIQTSFLTPPFGFALFYLRGVASKAIQTVQIYKGAVAFILLQLGGLAIAASFPSLVNYLPARGYLTSDTAPPPNNPRLQLCIEDMLIPVYEQQRSAIEKAISEARSGAYAGLPDKLRQSLIESLDDMARVFKMVDEIEASSQARAQYAQSYRPLHAATRELQARMRKLQGEIEGLQQAVRDERFAELADPTRIEALERSAIERQAQQHNLAQQIAPEWEASHARYRELATAERRARMAYRRVADDSYQVLRDLRMMLHDVAALQALAGEIRSLDEVIRNEAPDSAMLRIKALETALGDIGNVSPVKSKLSRARRALKRDAGSGKALEEWGKAVDALDAEIDWRLAARVKVLHRLDLLDEAVRGSIGLRMQPRLSQSQAKSIAACQARHRDLSLEF